MKDKSSLNIPNRKLTFLVPFCKCLMMKSALANKKLKKLKNDWLMQIYTVLTSILCFIILYSFIILHFDITCPGFFPVLAHLE